MSDALHYVRTHYHYKPLNKGVCLGRCNELQARRPATIHNKAYHLRVKDDSIMKQVFYTLIAVWFLATTASYGQTDRPTWLKEVVLTDVVLKQFSPAQVVTTIADSTALLSASRLSETLRYNSLLFLRENGPGGVASPSFRGTTAQQTAVVWNGLNINSQLNGQADMNTLGARNYDQVIIRRGGGSTIYGSGAVGGSIHLNNTMSFDDQFETQVTTAAGSFRTYALAAKTTYATQEWYADLGIDLNQSANDFEYLESPLTNENAAFSTLNVNTNMGWKDPNADANSRQSVKFYHNSFLSDREFSRTLTAPSQSGYKDAQSRSLLAYERKKGSATTAVKLAHIFEQFKFLTDVETPENYTIGKSTQYIGQLHYSYRFGAQKRLQSILEFNGTQAAGTNITTAQRRNYAGILLWQHQPGPRWGYTAQVRQDINSVFDSPFLLSGGAFYELIQKDDRPNSLGYRVSFNASRNFRVPTFNDLYWLGAGAEGNLDVVPESSWLGEIGHTLRYKRMRLQLNGFLIKSDNLINWQPNPSGIWRPINVAQVTNYGLETTATIGFDVQSHHFDAALQYGYTQSINEATNKNLIYTPMHKATFGLQHNYKWLRLNYQQLVVGPVFTTSDNTQTLDGYWVSNLIATFDVLQTAQTLSISLQAKNIFNTNYQTIAFRPNPGRNFMLQTTYIF